MTMATKKTTAAKAPAKKMGRPKFEPTAEQRELVQMLAAIGTPQEDVCLVIKDRNGNAIDSKTLRKHFRDELDTGLIRANARVAAGLFRQATNPKGGMPTVTAQIFWLKTRAGWRETAVVEATVKHETIPALPVSAEEAMRDALAAIGRRDEFQANGGKPATKKAAKKTTRKRRGSGKTSNA